MKKEVTVAITAASYSGNKGAAAMLQSSISQLKEAYGSRLHIYLMSVYPDEDRCQCPHDAVTVVPAQPQRVLLLAFPCAVAYRLFSWCPCVKQLLLHEPMLRAYSNTDLVIDEAGISFSDSRGFLLNTYAFACAAVPMLLGVPVVKYSQALGPFHHAYNRFLAGLVLPGMQLVVARGRDTYAHLKAIGIRNVRLYADGAFTMPPAPDVERRVRKMCEKVRLSHTVALSVSSVVERRCKKAGIDYIAVMADFIGYLTGRGYQVYLFANAARIHSKHPRNNDLMVGDAVAAAYARLQMKKRALCKAQGLSRRTRLYEAYGLIWEHREMEAEEIRALIGSCELLVASRFHAMVFALSRQVPVMLVGWSHKYAEVMEQFGLGEYAADYSSLSPQGLRESFAHFEKHQEEIRRKIQEHLPAVQESSRKNIRHIIKILDQIKTRQSQQKTEKRRYLHHTIDLGNPVRYMGKTLQCRMGYAADAEIRSVAASGGMVTALLCNLLKNHEIDGAWVVKTAFTETGELTYQTYVAVTEEQIRDAASSVYLSFPMLAHLDELREFDGRLAVVLTPCMMRAFCGVLEKEQRLREKVVLKIGLFCSGAHKKEATELALDQLHITRAKAERLYYRRGHWRGIASLYYTDGTKTDFSYTRSICAYKNAYFFIEKRCLSCQDQFAELADISFGDVWLKEMKKHKIKYTGCVIRSKKALRMLQRAQRQGDICSVPLSAEKVLISQKRALTFKYRDKRWNHRLAGALAAANRRLSKEHPQLLCKIPLPVIYYYMCAIRVLLSW